MGDWTGKEAGTGAGTGAAVGSAFGPLGTIAGGALGWLFGGLFGDKPQGYDPNWHAFNSPTTQYQKYGKDKDGNDIIGAVKGSQFGVPGYWAQMGDQFSQDPNRKSIQDARAKQLMGIQLAQKQAMGPNSIASSAAFDQSNQLRQQAHSASVAGNPMAQRMVMAQAQQRAAQNAGKSMLSEAQERQSKMGQVAKAAGAQSASERDWWKTQAQWQTAKSDMSAKSHQLGLAQKESQRRAMMDLEKLRAQLAMQVLASNTAQQGQWLGLMGEGAKAGGKLLKYA